MQLDKFVLMYRNNNLADEILSTEDECDILLKKINKTTDCCEAMSIAYKEMGTIEKRELDRKTVEVLCLDKEIYFNKSKKEVTFDMNEANTCFELTIKQGEKDSENKELLFYRKWQKQEEN